MQSCRVAALLKEYHEIVNEAPPLSGVFPTEADFFTDAFFTTRRIKCVSTKVEHISWHSCGSLPGHQMCTSAPVEGSTEAF